MRDKQPNVLTVLPMKHHCKTDDNIIACFINITPTQTMMFQSQLKPYAMFLALVTTDMSRF